MFLRSSFSHTKKFFQRSIESFKSLLSNGYTKIPKSPPCHCTINPFSCTRGGAGDMKFSHSYRELDSFYADHTTNQWHANNDASRPPTTTNNRIKNQFPYSTPTTNTSKLENQVDQNQDSIMSTNLTTGKNYQEKNRNQLEGKGAKGKGKGKEVIGEREEERISLVNEKLKELEMMDAGNVEHVLDIEEVIHYYSRLTCPAYRRIIDKFFVEMYSEFSSLQAAVGIVNLSRASTPMLQPRSMKV